MDFVAKLYREIQDLSRQVKLIRKGLVRLGKVHSINTTTCTVIVEFAGEGVDGSSAKSLPVPWLQRSTEHRPPVVGDHAVVIDPSLGNGAGLAITGWPSAANVSPGVATSDHVLYSGTAACKVASTDVRLGVAPTDFAALASRTDAEFARIWNMLTTWTPVSNDGGAALKTLASAASPGVLTVAATQVKVK